ncbi:MAG: ATP synthase F1 subunit epsilon [Anaeromicrobium sp.]|jgi:F-type H+-transporting ATPase subunit epsilon|uniref:ATP synthase F1 subunit epsilon n=1 Tax=Anaeromicrobium sp. TaxID=1929132 RepID=UPI0025F6A3AF|nr:ATP synthase F1 subunit epsilon [Anaeromicrobium sp.]MCT4592776.1 ATP synthase F1 subunit epsilon [Anaeromicrobium sp.]
MASTFKLEIVTPERDFFEGEVEEIVVRTVSGDLGILKDHMHTVSPLAPGVVKIKQEGKFKEAACSGGFIQVKTEKTTIVADACEWPDEIDVKRAEEALKRAEKNLDSSDENIDKKRARNAIRRAKARLLVTMKDR